MYVYLQPFHTKRLIDEANALTQSFGDNSVSLGDAVDLRVGYTIAALTGVVQSVYYVGIWVISTLASFILLGLCKPLDRLSDDSGALAVASLIGAGIGAFGIVHLSSAVRLSQKVVESVDASFEQMLKRSQVNFKLESDQLRSQRRSQATSRGEVARPEAHFEPALKKMQWNRTALVRECRRAYPNDVNSKFEAYRSTKARLRQIAIDQSWQMRSKPFSQIEIDRFLVQKITQLAEDGVGVLYHHCLKVWGERIRTWGTKFDREAFCRHSRKVFHQEKMTNQIERYIRQVSEADNKERAFRDSERDVKNLLSHLTNKIDNLDCPWLWVRGWRRFYPAVSSWRIAQWADSILDPDAGYSTKGR